MTFLPSAHPNLLSDYVDPFDREETETQWRRLTCLSEADPWYHTLLVRRTLPTNKGGSGIPNTADIASHALVVSVKAVAPMLEQYSPRTYRHMLSTLGTTDPLGVSLALSWCESDARCSGWQPVAGKEEGEDAYHVPPTVIPSTMIVDRQSYTDFTLAKNEHKLTRIKLGATYATDPEMYAEDWTQLVSQSSPGAAACLGIPPSWHAY